MVYKMKRNLVIFCLLFVKKASKKIDYFPKQQALYDLKDFTCYFQNSRFYVEDQGLTKVKKFIFFLVGHYIYCTFWQVQIGN